MKRLIALLTLLFASSAFGAAGDVPLACQGTGCLVIVKGDAASATTLQVKSTATNQNAQIQFSTATPNQKWNVGQNVTLTDGSFEFWNATAGGSAKGTISTAGTWTLGNASGSTIQTVLQLQSFGGGSGGVNYLTVPDTYGFSLINEYSTGRSLLASNARSTAITSAPAYSKRTTSNGSSVIDLGISDAAPAVVFAYSPAATASGGGTLLNATSTFWTTTLGQVSTAGAWTLGTTATNSNVQAVYAGGGLTLYGRRFNTTSGGSLTEVASVNPNIYKAIESDFVDISTTARSLNGGTAIPGTKLIHIANPTGKGCSFWTNSVIEAGVVWHFSSPWGQTCTVTGTNVLTISGLGDSHTYTITCATSNTICTIQADSVVTGTTAVYIMELDI